MIADVIEYMVVFLTGGVVGLGLNFRWREKKMKKDHIPVLKAAFKEALATPDAEFSMTQQMETVDLLMDEGCILKRAKEDNVHCTLTIMWTRRSKKK